MARSLASRLSGRAQVLASAAGAAAPLWEKLNALASRPGMINMSQGMPDFAGSTIARRVAAAALEAGDQVKLSGFGNFDLRNKNERPGRNPKTGEEIPISARRVVTFRPGQKLKARVEAYAGSVQR